MINYPLPKDFLWGTATASYQVEGAVAEDGRKPSIWDTFSHTPGKIITGENGDLACDHYHRFKDDIKLMQELGCNAYRFSVAWPRVIPDGDGAVNPKGLDFYSRLVDALLEAEITPFVTCYHWDMPEATYQKHRGWHGRQTAHDFARFAGIVSKNFSDRVKNWFTINEFLCFTYLSYGMGIHAPGEKVNRKELNQLTHHALLGHGLAVDEIRGNAKSSIQVGVAENYRCFVPVMETPEHIAAAKKSFRTENGNYIVPVITGAYDPDWWERQGPDVPEIRDGDLKQISRPLDLAALNVYTGEFVRASGNGYQIIDFPDSYPLYNIFWMRHLPDALYWGLKWAADDLGIKNLYISENGCCGADQLNGGEILDIDRVNYLREYIRAASLAAQDGVNLKGYFQWSLMDNFEWAQGFAKRFGLYYTDFKTQKRTAKLSAQWFAKVTRENKVL